MKAPDFDYLRPDSLDEAVQVLAGQGDRAAIIAGGQSLLPLLHFRLSAPEVLIDIGRLPELRHIKDNGDQVEIGALVRHCELADHKLVAQTLPLIRQAMHHVAHPAVRHRGTIGGSLAMADPAAELPACCLALGAEISLASNQGVRRVAAADFFLAVYETARRPDEILTAIHIPKRPTGEIAIFDEIARRQGDFAMAGLALLATPAGKGLDNVRIGLLGVADRPVLAPRTMACLQGGPLDQRRIDDAVTLIADDADPPDDPAYPPDYRRHLVQVLLRRALQGLPL